MKQLILLTALILFSGAAYVIFSIMVFQPNTVRPLSFDETLDTSQLKNQENEVENPEILDQKNKAIQLISETILKYDEVAENLPQTAELTFDIFLQLVKRGKLPAVYPLIADQSVNPVSFEALNIDPEYSSSLNNSDSESILVNGQRTNCTPETSIFYGGPDDDTLICPSMRNNNTRIIVSGPGNDVIRAGSSPTMVNAGIGDDIINVGSGTTLVFIDTIENSTTINMNCQLASMQDKVLSSDYPLTWIYPYRHFLVFGPRVIKDNLNINSNLIKDRVTNGEITINGNCFNLVFANDNF